MTIDSTPDMVLIQASPISWDGGEDWCMNPLGNHKTTIHAAVARSREHWPGTPITLIMPQLADTERFHRKISDISAVKILFGNDASPLSRMVDACSELPDDAVVVRADAVNCFWIRDIVTRLIVMTRKDDLDCAKTPDDFPLYLAPDVYRVGALRRLFRELDGRSEAGAYHVHPKFAMFFSPEYVTAFLENIPPVADSYLHECRELCATVYNSQRMNVDKQKTIKAGAQLDYHYHIATEWLDSDMELLDVACGPWEGASMLAAKCRSVTGVDLDSETIAKNNAHNMLPNLSFMEGDVTCLPFKDGQFDAVTSFETVEHVDALKYFKELFRVLRSDGILIISTPQNSMGHIPLIPPHVHEYSLEEILALAGKFFAIEKILGIKQGCITRENDYRGHNTMLLLRKPKC